MEAHRDLSPLALHPAILPNWKTLRSPMILRTYSTDRSMGLFERILPRILKPLMKFASLSMMEVLVSHFCKLIHNDFCRLTLWLIAGEVIMTRNGCLDSADTRILHVDTSVPLWAFFDLVGCTTAIEMIGTLTVTTSFPTCS